MKTVMLIADGAGDYPCPELDDRTPLQAAEMPHTRRIAAAGEVRVLRTVFPSLPPGSDVCNLGLLGYDAEDNYTGRAPIEAAGQGMTLDADDVAIRCNLVQVEDGRMADYSAGHIATEAALPLIEKLNRELGGNGLKFFPGVSYRHLVVWKNGPDAVETTPPHDFSGQALDDYWPRGDRGGELKELMLKSRDVLRGEAANQIWLWGQGRTLNLETYQSRFGKTGTVITAVDLIKGIGVLAGLDVPDIPGATGYVDTDYAAKVAAAVEAIATKDFVYVHIEAPDECGHQGDAGLKTKALSDFDEKVVAPVWAELERRGEPYRLVITMDHRTPVSLMKHSREVVPLAVLEGPVGEVTAEAPFDESAGELPDCISHELVSGFLSDQ